MLCASERPTAIADRADPGEAGGDRAGLRVGEDDRGRREAATVTPPPAVVTAEAPVTDASTLVAIVLSVHRPPTEAVSAPSAEAATATAAARTLAVIDALSVARTSTPVPAEIEPPVTVACTCEAPVARS